MIIDPAAIVIRINTVASSIRPVPIKTPDNPNPNAEPISVKNPPIPDDVLLCDEGITSLINGW